MTPCVARAGMENADVTPARSHYTTFLNKREELTPEEGGSVSVYLSEPTTWCARRRNLPRISLCTAPSLMRRLRHVAGTTRR